MKRKDIFTRTKKNIILMSFAIVAGILLVFSVMTECIYRGVLFDTVDQQLQTQKNMVINDAHIQYEGEKIKAVVLPAPLVKELINYVWQGKSLIKESPHTYEGSQKYPIFPKNSDPEKIYLIEDGNQYYRGIQFMLEDCRVQLLVSVNSQMASLDSLRKALLAAFLVLSVVAIGLSFYLASIALGPLNHAYAKMAHFIQDASHEMRTPLAVIRGKLELLAQKGREPVEAHYEELGMIMSEIRGLEKLNKDLLLLSKEDLPGQLESKEVLLQDLIDEITMIYEEIAQMNAIQLTLDVSVKDIQVIWDIARVKRCICILLDNAFKYTKPNGSVTFEVRCEEKKVNVMIKDTGYGIKKDELPYIFDRFYRSSEMRSRQIEGSGIGLSLLKSLAHTMGIKVKVKSIYGEGSTFILEIPMKMV